MHRFTPDIVAEHLEELPSDCARRTALLSDQRAFPTHLRELDGIIGARIEGIALAGTSAERSLAAAAGSDDADESCAATMCLLALGTPSAWEAVAAALASGTGGWAGIAKALAWSRAEPPVGALHQLADAAEPPRAVVGLLGLAARGDAGDRAARIARLSADADPAVRSHAFLAAALATVRLGRRDEILRETDPGVRRIAIEAAAWSAEPWLAGSRCAHPDVLAGVAAVTPDLGDHEREAFIETCLDPALGDARFGILASYGHPSVVPVLIDALASAEPATALAAGAAFSRLFAADIDSERSVAPSCEHLDDFDRAFVEEAALPDPELAQRLWDDVRPSLASATRIASGVDVGRAFDPEALDLRSRREWAMRRAYREGGRGEGGLGEAERLGE